MSVRVAVPSSAPGGLEAPMAQHFGHCEVFTIVELDHGEIKNTYTLQNVPHSQGGCMVPVNMLAQAGVNVLIAGGMGMRPLQGFLQNGIEVYQDTVSRTVQEAISAFMKSNLTPFGTEHVCRGGGGGGHCAH